MADVQLRKERRCESGLAKETTRMRYAWPLAASTHSVSLAPTVVRASATAAACAAESRTQSAAWRQLTTSRLPMTEAAVDATTSRGCESVVVSGAAFSTLTLRHRFLTVIKDRMNGSVSLQTLMLSHIL